jgi:lipid-binding SYLF domain-containing protein
MMKRKILFIFIAAVIFTLTFSVAGLAQSAAKDNDARDTKDQAERAQNAAAVLTEIMNIPEGGIPEELMSRAKGIAVIPHVVKGAIGIGGRHGKGLVSQRDASGKWSAPSFVDIGGASFGLQLGVQATDVVLVFTNEQGLKSLLDGKVTLGADASVAAGPLGRKASASTDIKLNSAIFSYSRSKGLFAGVSLDGAAITIDDSGNQKVYGKDVDAKNILIARTVKPNSIVAPFMAALEKYAPSRPTQQ